MSELTGIVTARSQYGIKIEGDDDWYNWSKEDFRGEPWEADKATKGKRVLCEVDGKYIQTIRVLNGSTEQTAPETGMFGPAQGESSWSYEKKDRLMCRESCAKSAVAIFAASIQAGIYKTHPDVSAVTAYAGALEKWCLEAIQGEEA